MSEHIIQSAGTLLSDCEELYGRYGRYINKWRAFPLYEDGLKLAERRILYSEYLTARKKYTKSAEVVGYCIGKLHPHGDQSAYQTLVQLCNCGLSDYNGNFGTSIGLHDEPAAAMRYTEVKMSQDVVNIAFQHLDFIPFEELELPTKEPIYLATKLPFCLLRKTSYCTGIGFGFKTYMPSYIYGNINNKEINYIRGYQKSKEYEELKKLEKKLTLEDYKLLLKMLIALKGIL